MKRIFCVFVVCFLLVFVPAFSQDFSDMFKGEHACSYNFMSSYILDIGVVPSTNVSGVGCKLTHWTGVYAGLAIYQDSINLGRGKGEMDYYIGFSAGRWESTLWLFDVPTDKLFDGLRGDLLDLSIRVSFFKEKKFSLYLNPQILWGTGDDSPEGGYYIKVGLITDPSIKHFSLDLAVIENNGVNDQHTLLFQLNGGPKWIFLHRDFVFPNVEISLPFYSDEIGFEYSFGISMSF